METIQEHKVMQFTEGWLHPNTMLSIREEAKQALKGMDFPTTRVEDWKYTRTTKITSKKYAQQTSSASKQSYLISYPNSHVLVFVNGYFDSQQSIILDDTISILKIEDLNAELYTEVLDDTEENVFSLINKAYSTGGVYIHAPKNAQAQYPIQLVHILTGNQVVANSRHFIHLEEGSSLYTAITFHSEQAVDCFNNCVLEGYVGKNAHLKLDKIQNEENSVFHISKECFIQDPDSSFLLNTITLGGSIVRNSLNILVEGQNCYTEINGVYLGKEKQHLDNHTFVDHLFSNCTSSETYKGVMDENSTGVFNGKVIVRQDAQKIEAYQSNGNILLSNTAAVNSKPELEIYADDVRCSHGSTTGQLDDEALFYLRARGINKKSAQKLLVAAFIGEVLEKVSNQETRNYIDTLFLERYGWEF